MRPRPPGTSRIAIRADQEQKVWITPGRVAWSLLAVVLGLTALSLLGQVAVHVLPDFVPRDRFAVTFDLDAEGNIPSLYATLTLLAASFLLRVTARVERDAGGPFARRWSALSVIFAALAADEYLSFHEELNARLHLSGFTQFPWVVVGAPLAALVALACLRLLLSLPPRVRGLLALAGFLYLSGAVGMETVGGHFVTRWGHGSLTYALCTSTEETLEMLGVLVFIYGLLVHLTEGGRRMVLALGISSAADGGARSTDA